MSDWYKKNRDRILEDKRKRYANDEAFREKKREKALDNYHNKQKKKLDMMVITLPFAISKTDSL
jgi:hypothetical protein